MFLFVFQHPFFGWQRTPAVLTPLLFASVLANEIFPRLLLLQRFPQHFPGLLTVKILCAKFPALNYDSGRLMQEHNASGHLIDILAAGSRRTHKRLYNIGL